MSQAPNIFRIAIFTPLRRIFDYLPPADVELDKIQIGVRVRVPFGRREVFGILIEKVTASSVPWEQLKPIIEVLDQETVFSPTMLQLLKRASDYYHHALGDVFACALPILLRQGKAAVDKQKNNLKSEQSGISNAPLSLNSHQQKAVDAIKEGLGQFKVFLLEGITGSGKTEVYLQTISQVLQQGKQALVLVPEIGLTPQMIARFKQRFAEPLAILHSGLTNRQRLDAWLQAKEGQARIVIGTRSAIFTPLLNPGIIIIDEEHDLSFKQQEGFRYSARDLAIIRSKLENIPIVLGSATPSLESIYNVNQNKYDRLHLPNRVATAVPPKIGLLDLRNQKLEQGLSLQLLAKIQDHLQAKGQVLLFLNRRGFAPILICHACGWVADCKRCDVKLTLHQHPALLQCHHCGSQCAIQKQCPNCSNQNLLPLGLGTQRLEQTLKQYFPNSGIVRIDRDSTRRKGSLENILQTIHEGENQILIGTQMLAKGHHFPDVTLVAILNADNGLFSADFRASEHMAQLLIQVAGRAGRAERPGEVLVQTHNPEHPLLQHLLQQDYTGFAQLALQERQAANLAPYSYFALLRAESPHKNYATQFLSEVRDVAKNIVGKTIEILGPIPSLIERKAGRYRAQLLLQSSQRSSLHNSLYKILEKIESVPSVRKVRWSLDVDPQDIL